MKKMSLLSKIFGDANARVISELEKKVAAINEFENRFKSFKAADFIKQTQAWQAELKDKGFPEQQKILDRILPEAFALVRAAAMQTLGQRHYDVQLISGMVLHQGNIAEMRTGEGKTLAATTAVYLNALTGRGVHVITVNDYLSRRDAIWMGQVYDILGLSTSCLNHEQAYLYNKNIKTEELDEQRDQLGSFKVVHDFLEPVERKRAYKADITYGTNNEFGFDYLRDNMVQNWADKVQRELHYAIVDEVDSILIDEARTPLIISAPDTEPTKKYIEFARLVSRLKVDEDYNIDEKMRAATLSEEGIKKMEEWLGVENIYTDRGLRDVHHIEQALKAQVLFKKDKDYVVRDGEVVIVDEFTGRLMFGRRYSEGLHQAIEAKENVEIKQESVTMATITFQNYFRLYSKLAGMTGTAATEAEEFSKIYNLDVLVIPTNRPMIRNDKSDVIFKTESEKYDALVAEMKTRSELGQPVLVGTVSIEKNELISNRLAREGIDHQVLNAKNHEAEGEIIAQAGRRGAVTVATNMAGRGVDIILGGNPASKAAEAEVKKLGGLHVLGTERHESRRIDNQLRGRSGRQGDSGSSQFFVSMEDDLMRIFGGERMKSLMQTLGVPDGMPIENKMISRSIERAQQKVEGNNFDIRKHLVEYDDVINKHREVIYKKRNEVLGSADQSTRDTILNYLQKEIEQVVTFHTQSPAEDEWNLEEIYEILDTIFPVPIEVRIKMEDIKDLAGSEEQDRAAREKLISYLVSLSKHQYEELTNRVAADFERDETFKKRLEQDSLTAIQYIEKNLLLRAIDTLWVEHIDAMDHMRRGIGLQGYGQKDPLVEYKKEARRMFSELLANIRKQVVYTIFKVGVSPHQATPEQTQQMNFSGAAKTSEDFDKQKQIVSGRTSISQPAKLGAISSSIKTAPVDNKNDQFKGVGRNDPCPCGSGKKYKKCHGA